MALALSWLAFPLLLAALSFGCGLLVERAARLRLPGTLLVPAGLAAVILVGQFATLTDATAELAAPVAAALAVAGLVLGRPRLRLDVWASTAAVGAFAAYAAPIVLSGQATFAGYIKLDDTSTFLALTDRALEHGRSLAGLAPSTYETTLSVNLAHGYPLGSLMPLGIGSDLVGQDGAWLFQPTMAFFAALLALALYALAEPLVRSAPLRALVAFAAAQPALLYAYSLWGGIKELAAAPLLPLVAALAVPALRDVRPRAFVPAGVAAAAALGVLSLGGAVWVVPLLAAVAALAIARGGRRTGLLSSGLLVGTTALLSLPALLAAPEFLRPANEEPFTSGAELGNLIRPLRLVQVFGIWPAGDFRVDPDALTETYVLVGVAAFTGVLGLALAFRRRAWLPLAYVGAMVLGGAVLAAAGSPWVAAKAYATVAPAIALAALAGAAGVVESGRRAAGAVLVGALTFGVLWSNALAYHDVWLAPRPHLRELEEIGERFAGRAPALMTEYEPYGVRHFLRRLDAEGASELRRRLVPLRDGRVLGKSEYVDLDQFRLPDLFIYRTLVLRRSPVLSRPPSAYSPAWSGRYYEVWEQGPGPRVLEHLPLGDELHAAAVPRCADVLRLAKIASRAGGRLAAAPRAPAIVVPLAGTAHPEDWVIDPGNSSIVVPGAGTLDAEVTVPSAGRYAVWLGGSFKRRLEALVDGQRVSSVRHRLNNTAQYNPLGEVSLAAGRHRVTLRYGGSDLLPGSGGQDFAVGPLVLAPGRSEKVLVYVQPKRARTLCGRSLDWIEAVSP